MAILCTFTTRSGIELSNAYIRIDTLSGHKGEIRGTANAYFSPDAWDSGQDYVQQFAIAFVPVPHEALWPQAYHRLKELPELAGSVDA